MHSVDWIAEYYLFFDPSNTSQRLSCLQSLQLLGIKNFVGQEKREIVAVNAAVDAAVVAHQRLK